MPRAALSFALAASMAGLWPVAGSMAGLWPAGSALAAGPQPEAPTSLTAPTLQPMPDAISTDPATAKPATGVKPVKPGRAKPVEPAKAAKTAPAGPIAPKRAERSVPQPDFALRSSVPDDPVITGTTTPRKAYTPASPGDATVPVDPSLDVTAPAPDQGDDDQLVPNITVPDPAMQPPGVAPTTAWTPARSSSSTQPAGNPQTTTDPNAAPPQVTPQAPRKARPKPNSPGPAQPVQVPVAADQAKLAATVAIPATTPSPRSMEADPLAESPTLYDPQGL
ncbi:MAG: hypothetical protein P4L82_06865, partial [Ancalomicrobiaceae bacterium]|nr:hypothetical protein [Ancalomicrobiaceae bacterium]